MSLIYIFKLNLNFIIIYWYILLSLNSKIYNIIYKYYQNNFQIMARIYKFMYTYNHNYKKKISYLDQK